MASNRTAALIVAAGSAVGLWGLYRWSQRKMAEQRLRQARMPAR